MTDVEELIRTRVDRLEETFGAGLLELPPKTRSRVRVRQIVTAVSTATAIALVAVLAVLTVDHLAMPRHVRPAGRTAVPHHKLTPLKNGETTGVLATFDVDGDTYTLQVGTAIGSVALELHGPGGIGIYTLPSPGQLEVKSGSRIFTSAMIIAGLAPSNAATVKVTTTDGRSLEASIYLLPSSYTSDFEAFGAAMPAPPAQFTVTAYDANGDAIGTNWNPIRTSPPTPPD